MNRLLIARSYSGLNIRGDSAADDVRLMRDGLDALAEGRPIECGAAGTTLRFLALRASRVPGRHVLTGHARLFERPQDELVQVLSQLGVTAELHPTSLVIEGDGWRLSGDTLHVPSGRSSQFATAVLMNAWDLPFDLYVSLGGARVSEGYWRMSVRLCEQLGMRLDFWDADFRVGRASKVEASEASAEIDVSSAFALAAIAAVGGHVRLIDFPNPSLQPDAGFVDVLRAMGVVVTQDERGLRIERAPRLTGVAVNLKTMPDLFPVLAILCALAHGESRLYGAPHLVHKESDRLGRIADLITKLGRTIERREDGLIIRSDLPPTGPGPGLIFDCDQDHRLAFAAALVRTAGFAITIEHPEVVAKSFPEFWSIVGWTP